MYKDQIPLGDFGEAEDLGPLAVYLASDAARYVTGTAIVDRRRLHALVEAIRAKPCRLFATAAAPVYNGPVSTAG